MPGRSTLLKRSKRQRAVYWGSPVTTGEGGREFAEPVELAVRWEDRAELFRDPNGEERTSQAIVEVLVDVDLGGYLWKGTLSELDSAAQSPLDLKGAFEICKFEKIPFLNPPTRYTRHAYLV